MEHVKLYGTAEIIAKEHMQLEYYIISEHIGFENCNLMSYGIRVKKTVYYDGGGKTIETNQINNVFYRLDDAEEFIHLIIRNKVTPVTLRDVVEDYIVESIASARKQV